MQPGQIIDGVRVRGGAVAVELAWGLAGVRHVGGVCIVVGAGGSCLSAYRQVKKNGIEGATLNPMGLIPLDPLYIVPPVAVVTLDSL